MSKRYAHFLRKTKTDRFPQRIVGLAVSSTFDKLDYADTHQREHLKVWAASGMAVNDEMDGRVWSRESSDTAGLWSAVRRGLRHGGTTLVISYGCARVWGLCGLWELIESGELTLEGRDDGKGNSNGETVEVPDVSSRGGGDTNEHQAEGDTTLPVVRRSSTHVGRARERSGGKTHRGSGIAILQDPPTILCVRAHGLPGVLQLVDLRNYGIDCYPDNLPVHKQADWLRQVITSMILALRHNGWGGLRLTAGSQAMYTFRRTYMRDAILCHMSGRALALEEAAYYGGRCECRYIGDVPGMVHHLDFRSMYGSIMAETYMPVRLRGVIYDGEPPWDWRTDTERGVIAEVSVETDEQAYPLRRDGLTIYPVGRFTTTLAGPELADAHKLGRVKRWHCASWYDMMPCLDDYAVDVMTYLQWYRKQRLPALEQWCKALLVCLSGKFGQRGSSWVPYPEGLPPAPWCQWTRRQEDGTIVRARALGWQCQREEREPWGEDAVPAIAAWITSAGRMKLLSAIRQAGWGNVYYYDTDSLFVSDRGAFLLTDEYINTSGEPGKLRVIESANNVRIVGIKHYEVAGRHVCSGQPKGDVSAGPTSTQYWYRDWLANAVRAGHRPYVERVLREYARSEVYRHGRVRDDGLVDPIEITGGSA